MAAAAGAVFLASAAGWAFTRVAAEAALVAEARRHLARAVRLGALRLQGSQDLPLDSVTHALARSTQYRVSVFGSDLTLLSDPQLGVGGGNGGAPAAGSADAAGRDASAAQAAPSVPVEVAEAFRNARTTAFSRRRGEIDGRPAMFSAVRLFWQGEPAVIRFGAPAGPVEEAASRTARNAALGVGAAGAVVLCALYWWLGGFVRALQAIAALLAGIAAGWTPRRRVRLSPVAELARLGSAANRARNELDTRVARADRERDELAGFMDQIAEGIMALAADGRVLWINPAAKELLGVTEVPRFAPVGSVVRDPVLRSLLENPVPNGERRSEVDVGGRRLDVRTTQRAEGGSVAVLVDLTKIRRLEEVRSDFVANASHELKTPLTVIRGAAEMVLAEDLPDDLRDQFLRSIERNTVRLQRMVDDLLDLSRYESGGWRPQQEGVRVAEVAKSVWGEMAKEAETRGISFDVSGEGKATGDEGAVYQVFRNLFENALKHVPDDGGQIRVAIEESDDGLRVTVRDNGAGIPAAALPRIFERFYRIDAARSREGGGTGLGLAIVRHLVSSMGGKVWAESNLGAGTTIGFSLPRYSRARG